MGPRHHLSFCASNMPCLAPELQVSMCPRPHLWFWLQNSVLWDRIIRLYWSQSSPVILCRQYAVISTRITSLYWSQTPPVILCMQNRVIRTRISILHESQPSSVVLCIQNSDFMTRIICMYGPRPQLWICVCKTAWLQPKLIVSMGPRSHLRFLHAKQRLLDKNYKSLCVPDLTCRFVQVICTRMTSLYGFQHSCVVLCLQNSVFRTRLIRLYGS